MKKRNSTRIIVLAVTIVVLLLLAGVAFFVIKSLTSLDSLAIAPDFAEQELDINADYTFTITADPEKASLKSVEYVVDNAAATFAASDTEEGKAVLHTMAEGTVTVCVRKSDIESNYLTFVIVDQAAKAAAEAEAQAQAEAEAAAAAQAAAEAEALANATELVMVNGDNVRMRSMPSTDGEILTTCKMGDSFTRYEETEDGWSRLDYNGADGFIKSEFLQVTTEEELQQAREEAEKKAEEDKKAEEEKKDEKKEETSNAAADPAAAAATDAANAAAAANQAAADAAAQQAAAAQAAAAAAAASPYVWTYQGTGFTQQEVNYFHSLWDYTEQYDEMVTHHSAGELVHLCELKGWR